MNTVLSDGCLLRPLLAMLAAFAIALRFSPSIARLSHKFGIHARPNHRSSHDAHIPNTGGILLFLAVLIPVFIFSRFNYADDAVLLIIAFLVLFITGVVDDLKNVNVLSKFLGQFFPALLILISLANQDLPLPFINDSVYFSVNLKYSIWILIIVAMMNAYNLIDGIDGLAISLGIVAGLLFGIYFLLHAQCNLAVIGFALVGGMLGMIRYNVYKGRHKLFIGDSGSLLIGGIVSLFALKFIESEGISQLDYSSSMILGVTFIPVADLVRVTAMRVLGGRSPFSADRNHIHHIIIDRFGFSHFSTTVTIVAAQLLIFLSMLAYNTWINFSPVIYLIFLLFAYFLITYKLRHPGSAFRDPKSPLAH